MILQLLLHRRHNFAQASGRCLIFSNACSNQLNRIIFLCVFILLAILVHGCGGGGSTQTQPHQKTGEAGLDNWHIRFPTPNDSNLNDIQYGNGVFVAVGDNGSILTSPSGGDWMAVKSGVSDSLNGITFANGNFIVVGGSSGDHRRTILTSADGINWTIVESGPGESLNALDYGNSTFVAVGDNGSILSSSNGTLWSETFIPAQQEGDYAGFAIFLYDITYASGVFVAVGSFGIIMTSPDGIVWTERHSLQSPDAFINAVTFANGTFVAVGTRVLVRFGSGIIFTSPDGITWTKAVAVNSASLFEITAGNGTFVAVGASGSILTSVDGKIWANSSSGTDRNLYDVTYGNGTFVVAGEDGTILQSDPIDLASTSSTQP